MIPTRLLAGMLLMAASAAHALDFRTVGPATAILYDTPSAKGSKLYVVPQGMPLQVMLSYGEWVKVRDMNGEVAWMQARALSARRNVLVRVPGAKVFAEANEAAPVLMTADKGVLLELVDPNAITWARVRHRDGITGYIRASDIWGL